MTRAHALTWAAPLALALAACGGALRPTVLADVERTRSSPAAREAAELSPDAYAHAEKLRREADEASAAGDPASAQLLAERAIAAYDHAFVLARIVRATRVNDDAQHALKQASAQLERSEAELARVNAEADDLERRARVLRDALPVSASRATDDPVREHARLAAARSLALDARLLCAAARQLTPAGDAAQAVQAADDATAALDAKLKAAPHPAPIDAAADARARCLSVLTVARRAAAAASATGRADAVLAELSKVASLAPSRDDRGVVVALRGVGVGELARPAGDQARAVGRVAAAHPESPVLVVVHAGKRVDPARDRARGASVAKALAAAGVAEARVRVELAGDAHPVSDRDPARNERVEIVLVDAGG